MYTYPEALYVDAIQYITIFIYYQNGAHKSSEYVKRTLNVQIYRSIQRKNYIMCKYEEQNHSPDTALLQILANGVLSRLSDGLL